MKTYELHQEEMELIYEMAHKADIKGRTYINQAKERKGNLEYQITGQIGEYIGIRFITNNPENYVLKRTEQNAAPWEGDGGSDLYDLNVDIKTSLMRSRRMAPQNYSLIVNEKERAPGRIFFFCLVDSYSPTAAVAHLMGWAPDEMVGQYKNKANGFDSDYSILAHKLLCLRDFKGFYMAKLEQNQHYNSSIL